jgi:hypothetical protein
MQKSVIFTLGALNEFNNSFKKLKLHFSGKYNGFNVMTGSFESFVFVIPIHEL